MATAATDLREWYKLLALMFAIGSVINGISVFSGPWTDYTLLMILVEVFFLLLLAAIARELWITRPLRPA